MAATRSLDPVGVDESFLAHVRLACVPGVGGILRQRLLERFGSPEGVFAASPAELAGVSKIGPKLVRAIPEFAASRVAEETLDLCRRRGVGILVEGGPEVLASFAALDAIDEVWAFVAPKLLGGDAPAITGHGQAALSLASSIEIEEITHPGGDILIRGTVRKA